MGRLRTLLLSSRPHTPTPVARSAAATSSGCASRCCDTQKAASRLPTSNSCFNVAASGTVSAKLFHASAGTGREPEIPAWMSTESGNWMSGFSRRYGAAAAVGRTKRRSNKVMIGQLLGLWVPKEGLRAGPGKLSRQAAHPACGTLSQFVACCIGLLAARTHAQRGLEGPNVTAAEYAPTNTPVCSSAPGAAVLFSRPAFSSCMKACMSFTGSTPGTGA